MEVKIDKGIPLPTDIRNDLKYPFDKLEVGDSIFFPLSDEDNANRMKNRLAQATRTFGKKATPERHFVIRYRLEDEVSGVRVWRRD
jgi:hypothetical protein|tara:strand:- start:100 stop:357 length:258 start_codon:yes stop_codon:yes gene_type:complete